MPQIFGVISRQSILTTATAIFGGASYLYQVTVKCTNGTLRVVEFLLVNGTTWMSKRLVDLLRRSVEVEDGVSKMVVEVIVSEAVYVYMQPADLTPSPMYPVFLRHDCFIRSRKLQPKCKGIQLVFLQCQRSCIPPYLLLQT